MPSTGRIVSHRILFRNDGPYRRSATETDHERRSSASTAPRARIGSATAFRCARCSRYDSHGAAHQPVPAARLRRPGAVRRRPSSARGVGEHPHRGFETVTIVYEGEVEHRDSTGAGGVIGPGDVQWMTAASGILHEEFHSPRLRRDAAARSRWCSSGSTCRPRTRWRAAATRRCSTPTSRRSSLPDGAGKRARHRRRVRRRQGPGATFTPINVWDVRLNADSDGDARPAGGPHAALVVLAGTVAGQRRSEIAREAQMVLLDRDGGEVAIEANADATLLRADRRADRRAGRRLRTVRHEHPGRDPAGDRRLQQRQVRRDRRRLKLRPRPARPGSFYRCAWSVRLRHVKARHTRDRHKALCMNGAAGAPSAGGRHESSRLSRSRPEGSRGSTQARDRGARREWRACSPSRGERPRSQRIAEA